MSFPHRTAFYDPHVDKIKLPNEIPFALSSEGKVHEITNGLFSRRSDLIPLASTGLEDSEGNEIFEGHILETQIYRRPKTEITCVVYFEGHFFAWTDELDLGEHHPYLDQKVGIEYRNETSIIGHALTDPDLVPDSFDVYDYFNISEEE